MPVSSRISTGMVTRPRRAGLLTAPLLAAAALLLLAAPAFAGDTLGDLLDPITDPVDEIIDPVTEPVEEALDPVTDPVEEVLQPVTDPVGEVVEPVAEVAETVALPVTQPVTNQVGEVVETVVQPAVQPLTNQVGEVVEDVVQPITQPIVDAVTAPAVGVRPPDDLVEEPTPPIAEGTLPSRTSNAHRGDTTQPQTPIVESGRSTAAPMRMRTTVAGPATPTVQPMAHSSSLERGIDRVAQLMRALSQASGSALGASGIGLTALATLAAIALIPPRFMGRLIPASVFWRPMHDVLPPDPPG